MVKMYIRTGFAPVTSLSCSTIGQTALANDETASPEISRVIAEPFALSQGRHLDASPGVRADFRSRGLSADIEKMAIRWANRFSCDDPFSLAVGKQRRPLRPRTVRIGIDAKF